MKTIPSRLAAAVTFTLILSFSSSPTSAQTDGYISASNLHGVVSGNTYGFGKIDNVNFGTGAVNIDIPLYSRKGRGLTQTGHYSYSSKELIPVPMWDPIIPTQLDGFTWTESSQINSFIAATPGGGVGDNEQEYDCTINGNYYLQEYVDSNFMFITNDGATYQFPNRHVWNSDGSNPNSKHCPGVKLTEYDVAPSSEGEMLLNTTNWPTSVTVTMKDGTMVTFAGIEDTNGNLITGGGTEDTLQRTTLLDSNGNTQSFTKQWGSSNTTTAFSTTGCNSKPNFVHNFSGLLSVVTSLTLPNNWVFNFTYDPTWGSIAKVTLPSGGYIRYDYTVVSCGDPGPPNSYTNVDSLRVNHRYISPDGNPAHEQTWTYT